MKNKYYDNDGFKKIMALVDINPYKAISKLKEYFNNYPLDYSSYPYYISLLILIGEFNLAEEKINYIQNIFTSGIYKNDERRSAILKHSILYAKLKLLCYQEKYEEAYNLYQDNKNNTEDLNIDKILFFCKKQMGLIDKKAYQERDYYPYFYRQVMDYQESDFIHHAQKHCTDNPFKDEDNITEFIPNFPLQEVVEEIKKYIPSDKKLYPGFIDNMYFFKYDNCGISDNIPINFIKVITFDNSKNIITMYPYRSIKNFPYVDLNYMKEEKKDTKVKKLSQIDKFNKRFGNKY